MIRRKLRILGSSALLLALLLPGCVKIDTLPQLEILVLEQNDAFVSGAYVALFESVDEWNNRSNPAQVWRNTDAEGKVLFVDLKEIDYFIYVRYDGKDNSLGEMSTDKPLKMNQRDKIIIHIR